MPSNLAKLKLLLNITTDDQDVKLALVLEIIQEQALIYLNQSGKAPPIGLEAVILQMTLDYLQQNPLGIEGIEANNIKSIKRGDVQTTYNIAEVQSMGAFISLYGDLLRPFMKVRMR